MGTIFNNNRVIKVNHSKVIQTKLRIPITKDNTLTLQIRIQYTPTQLHQHHNSKTTKAPTSLTTLTIPCLHKMKYNIQLTLHEHPPGDLIIHQQDQVKNPPGNHIIHHQDQAQATHQENLTLSQILFCHMENDCNEHFWMKGCKFLVAVV